MHVYRALLVGSSICLAGIAAGPGAPSAAGARASSPAPPEDSLKGAWEVQEYALASGARHEVRGRIVFTADEWLVLFFVMDGQEPRRGSGEGGRYSFDGETLTFEHLFHLSAGEEMEGLSESALTMTARDGEGPLEPTGVELDGDRLTLRFPSGNSMSFARSSAP